MLAVTRDPFLVYSSNAFALLGLRSLYFLLAGAIERMRHLKPALAVILIFVAVKLLLHDIVHIPAGASLAGILGIVAAAVLASRLAPAKPMCSAG